MPTTERDRYRAALAALQAAQADVRRADLMAQIALNRVREAEDEGFDDEAARREARRLELVAAYDREQAASARLADATEAQRHLAVGEEVDNTAASYDDALHALLASLDSVAAAVASVTALAERASTLAATLPADHAGPRQTASAATNQARVLSRHLDRLVDAAITVPLSPPNQAQR